MTFEKFIAAAAQHGVTATPDARRKAIDALLGNANVPPPAPPALDRALTLKAAARAAGFSVMTIRRAIVAGTMNVVWPTGIRPRILESELRRWIEGRPRKPTPTKKIGADADHDEH